MKFTNPLKTLHNTYWVHRLIRRLSRFAWKEMLWDVRRVEWKYGRTDDGKLKDWTEWNNIRLHLLEAGELLETTCQEAMRKTVLHSKSEVNSERSV